MKRDFVPNGKLVGEESFSIQSNYLGTPEVMYAADGKVIWSAELDAYGDVRELTGERTECPFRYQGQYEDRETGLYYNRFRYYSVEEGMYISQDRIKLIGGHRFYNYVSNSNKTIDVFGLARKKVSTVKLANGKEYTGYSGAPGTADTPLLTSKEGYDQSVAQAVERNKENDNGGFYGKCAEINAINQALLGGETRETLAGTTIDTKFNKNRKAALDRPAVKKGDPVEACDCCAEIIKEFKLKEVNKGCGNK